MDPILYAIPAFFVLIGAELLVGWIRGVHTYRVNDAVASIGTGVLMTASGLVTGGVRLGIYALVYHHYRLATLDVASIGVWLGALLGYDLCYYWFHRLSHERNLLWAAHAVHHQSEDYNLSTALRQTSTGFLYAWFFYLPLAVAGVPPLVFAAVGAINLLYQYWPHTQHIGRLGWIDRTFVTPSNHRVHHAQNPEYIDRNYGGILILWDRLFGTFAEERDEVKIIYGVRKPLNSWNPIWANLEIYWRMAQDAWHTRRWRDKLGLWFARTGWRPADVESTHPRPSVDLQTFAPFDTPVTGFCKAYVMVHFAMIIVASTAFLAVGGDWAMSGRVMVVAALALGLFSLGWMLEGRSHAWLVEGLRGLLTGLVAAVLAGNGWVPPWIPVAVAALAVVSVLAILVRGLRGRTPASRGQGDVDWEPPGSS